MATVESLRRGYGNICRYTDAAAAYADFHRELERDPPGLDTLLALPQNKESPANLAIHQARISRAAFLDGTPHYFRRSGIAVVGDSSGAIHAVNYMAIGFRGEPGRATDPVAEAHPNYHYVALRKAAFAVMLGRLGMLSTDLTERYNQAEALLQQWAIGTVYPHHLGYAAVCAAGSFYMAVGASGMLPSKAVSGAWHDDPALNATLQAGREKHWYNEEIDGGAGYHDAVFAETVLSFIINPDQGKPFAAAPSINSIQPADSTMLQTYGPGVNIH